MSVQLAIDSTNPLLVSNLSALAMRHLQVAQAVARRPDGAGVRGFEYAIEESRSGVPTLVAAQGDQRHYVHSKFDPVAEAKGLIKAAECGVRRNAILFGLGLGYTLEAALDVVTADGRVLVIESDPQVVRLALEHRDLAKVLNDPRVTLLINPTPNEAFAHWAHNFSMVIANGVAFVALPNVERRMPEGFPAQVADLVRGYMHTVAGNLQTLMVMAHVYLANTLRAVPYLLTKPGAGTLFGKFADVPVICVAAGPSLDKQLPLLAQVQDRCLIIACDTAVRPLRNAGIVPHLICAGDPQEANHRHIAGLAGQVDSYLCAEPMTYPSSLREFQDRLFLASFRDRLMIWIENLIGEIGAVQCWGSVATMVFDLARKLGGNPIIFLGQDLSFPGGRTYAEGTYFETELGHEMTAQAQAKRLNDPNFIECTDIYGQTVQTNRQMFAYHRWFVREMGKTAPGTRIINATEGGILKEGVEVRPFAEVVAEHLTAPVDAWGILADAHAQPVERDAVKLTAELEQLRDGLRELDREAKDGFRETGEWYRKVASMSQLPGMLAEEHLKTAEARRKVIVGRGIATTLMEMVNQTGIKSYLNAQYGLAGKSANKAVYLEAIEAYLKLFASVSKAMGRLKAPAEDAYQGAQAVLESRSVTAVGGER